MADADLSNEEKNQQETKDESLSQAAELRFVQIFWQCLVHPAWLFVIGLVIAYGFVENAVVSVIMDYITENWQEDDLALAAIIVNILEGIMAIICVFVARIADIRAGYFKIVIFIPALYVVGLVLLYLVHPLKNVVENPVFYLSMLLISVGQAGKDPPLKEFLKLQLPARIKHLDIVMWCIGRSFGAIGSSIAWSSNNTKWKDIFKISTITMGVAYLWFFFGICFYERQGPRAESHLRSFYKVLKTAISKRQLGYPQTPDRYSQNVKQELQFSPRYQTIRCIDKAAIIEEGRESCTVAQVKQAKGLLSLFPLWISFLTFALVEASRNTFFIKQSTNLDDSTSNNQDISIPINIFFIFTSLANYAVQLLANPPIPENWNSMNKRRAWLARICLLVNSLIPENWNSMKKRRAGLAGICLAMAFALLSCISAWQVEVHRLKLVMQNQLQDDERSTIHMSLFWLTPQFVFQGLMTGLAGSGLSLFLENFPDESMGVYEMRFQQLATAVGSFLSALFIHVCKNWFRDTINHSHLDKYYLLLVILTALNFIIFAFVLCKSMLHEPPQQLPLTNDVHPTADQPTGNDEALQDENLPIEQDGNQPTGNDEALQDENLPIEHDGNQPTGVDEAQQDEILPIEQDEEIFDISILFELF